MRAGRVAAIAALASLTTVGVAAAAPTQPTIVSVAPAFVRSATPTITWSAITFDAGSSSPIAIVTAKDLTAAVADISTSVASPATSATLPTLVNGHQYQLTVVGMNLVLTCIVPNPFGGCLSSANLPVFGSASPPITTRVDVTPPTGTLQINGGDVATNKRDVTLNMTASDPLSNGQPQSGVAQFQASQTGTFPACSLSAPECPVAFSATSPLTLAAGADGPRTVTVRFRDKAADICSPLCLFTPLGNVSANVTDTILLDRVPPTVSVAVNSPAPKVGTPFSFSAAGSRDGAGGSDDSGIDPAGFSWSFGDGTSGTGATIGHVYRKPGAFTGTVTARDRAGNFTSQTFTVNVPGVVKTVIDAGRVIQAKLRFRIAAQGDSLKFLQLNVTGAKKGAKVAVACKAGCAVKKNLTAKGATVSLTRLFSRGLKKPPIKIEVRVSKAGLVGKAFKYTFRPTGVTAIECNLLTTGKTSGCTRV